MTLPLPPLYALRAFEVAARHGSFTLAAQALFITQSAISRHVKTLEASLGCQLFERKGSKLALTDAGRLLAKELERSFRVIEHACTAVSREKGAFRIKAPSTLTMRWLMQVLQEFQAADERNRVQLTSVWMDLDTVDFRNEPFDCAVLLANGDFEEGWNAVKLFDEWLVPVCSPAIYSGPPWAVDKLADVELIHPSHDCRDWQRWLERQGLADSISWRKGKRFDTLEQGMSAAAKGHGVSIGDLSLVDGEVQNGSLMLPIKTAVKSGDSYYLVWPKSGVEHGLLSPMKDFLMLNLPTLNARDVQLLD